MSEYSVHAVMSGARTWAGARSAFRAERGRRCTAVSAGPGWAGAGCRHLAGRMVLAAAGESCTRAGGYGTNVLVVRQVSQTIATRTYVPVFSFFVPMLGRNRYAHAARGERAQCAAGGKL